MKDQLIPENLFDEDASLGVRRVEKCCATCQYFDRIYDDAYCEHPDFFGLEGPFVDEGMVCDKWEAYHK